MRKRFKNMDKRSKNTLSKMEFEEVRCYIVSLGTLVIYRFQCLQTFGLGLEKPDIDRIVEK